MAARARGGYEQGTASNYDPTLGIDTAEVFAFIGRTQVDGWNKLLVLRGGDADLAQAKFFERLGKALNERGTVDVLRHGVEDLGVLLRWPSSVRRQGATPTCWRGTTPTASRWPASSTTRRPIRPGRSTSRCSSAASRRPPPS